MLKQFLGCACALALVAPQADAACSRAKMAGTWGYRYTSIDFNLDVFCSGVGNLILSSNGTARLSGGKTSCNGTTFTEAGSGTFSVSGACLGSIGITFTNGAFGRYHFTVTDGGSALDFFLGSQGITVSGSARKQ